MNYKLSLLLLLFGHIAASAQVLLVGDKALAALAENASWTSREVRFLPLTNPTEEAGQLFLESTATLPQPEAILLCPPRDWFPRHADVDSTFNTFQQLAISLQERFPKARIVVATPMPNADPNINRNQQELFLLLEKELVASRKGLAFADLYTPLTEKLNIAVSPYPTSPKTKAEELAKRLRSPIPYREANSDLLTAEKLTPDGLKKLSRILAKLLR